jgi:uncharacterized repeat protein (TIGR03803 family)
MKSTGSALAIAAIFATAAIRTPLAQAETYTVLHSFAGSPGDGANPAASMVLDPPGNLYGTSYEGGAWNQGAVFEYPASGPETVLYSFTGGPDGGGPEAGLVFDSAGNLYGTTYFGGAYGYGVVFELSPGPSWTETVLYSFTGGPDGAYPMSTLVFDPAGNLYGTTSQGGGNGGGVLFILSPGPSWTETVAVSFPSGSMPGAGVVRDSAGNIYGTTEYGPGSPGYGEVYRLTGNFTTVWVHAFTGAPDGANPQGTLAVDSSGNIYGTTPYGGSGYGLVFKLTSNGTYTVLHTFTGGTAGAYPFAGLILGSGNDLYGVTYFGGASGDGTAFKMKTNGTETVLHSFKSGQYPFGGLVQNATGTYGTTYYGGTPGNGVLFELH